MAIVGDLDERMSAQAERKGFAFSRYDPITERKLGDLLEANGFGRHDAQARELLISQLVGAEWQKIQDRPSDGWDYVWRHIDELTGKAQ